VLSTGTSAEDLDAFITSAMKEIADNDTPLADETPDEDADDDADGNEDADDDDADEAGDEDREWLTDDLKSELAALGIGEDKLAEVESREELDRIMSFVDAAVLEAGRKSLGERDPKTGKFTPSKDKEKGGDEPEGESDGDEDETEYKVSLNPKIYDDEIIEEFGKFRDHITKLVDRRLAALETAESERAAQAEQAQFDAEIDKLGFDDIFGKTGKETEKQLANRKKVWDELEVYAAGLASKKRQLPKLDQLVVRVAFATFSDTITKEQQRQLISKARKQDARRLGSSRGKPSPRKYDGPVDEDPELLDLFDKLSKG
jgi:hypothetical protein